jgi:hypothetical protein
MDDNGDKGLECLRGAARERTSTQWEAQFSDLLFHVKEPEIQDGALTFDKRLALLMMN